MIGEENVLEQNEIVVKLIYRAIDEKVVVDDPIPEHGPARRYYQQRRGQMLYSGVKGINAGRAEEMETTHGVFGLGGLSSIEHAQFFNASDHSVYGALRIIFCTAKTGVGTSSATSRCQTRIERDAAGVMIRC